MENAVKIARYATGRPAVVAFDHAYHGRTNLTMALTAKNMPYKHRFGPFASEVYRMPMAYPLRWPGGPERCAAEALDVIKSLIHTQVGEDNVAAVLIEPIQGEGGFIVPPDGFLPGLAEFCRAHGIVLIADEIQSGLCRAGDWFACDHESVVPDLVTTAKGIADGLPLAGVTGRADLMDAVHPGGLGGTYGGNPVACAAALGSLETMVKEDLPARARRIGEIMLPRLHGIAEASPAIGDVRGRGAMLAVELVRPGGIEPDPAAAAKVAAACHQAGLLVLTCGTFGNVLRFLPPMVIGEPLLGRGAVHPGRGIRRALGAHRADPSRRGPRAAVATRAACRRWPAHRRRGRAACAARWPCWPSGRAAGPAAAASAASAVGPAGSVRYVALGDSYSAGLGTGDYIAASGILRPERRSLPGALGRANQPASFVSVACAGATTGSVLSSQIPALSPATTLVSITIGGNDVGFSSVMETCVLRSTSTCVSAISAAEAEMTSQLPGKLDRVLGAIARRAPDRQGGCPRLPAPLRPGQVRPAASA